jgi:hypothetical protein
MYVTNLQYFCALTSMVLVGFVIGSIFTRSIEKHF